MKFHNLDYIRSPAGSQESGMVEANQQSTKREEKDDEVVDTSTSASSDEAAEDDGLNSAEGKSIEKTTLFVQISIHPNIMR